LDIKSYNLQTKDYYSLLNLHKILLEAKFHPKPEDAQVSGSPFLAGLYQEVVSALLQSEKAPEWESWLQLKNRTDYRQRAIIQMRTCGEWKTAAPEEKRKLAQIHLAPFLYTEKELEEVIKEAEKEDTVNKQYSDAVFAKMETVTDKNSFIEFLNLLEKDNAVNSPEWENKTIREFLQAMSSWIEDFSESDYNDIDWETPDYKTMAKILYMGKLYE